MRGKCAILLDKDFKNINEMLKSGESAFNVRKTWGLSAGLFYYWVNKGKIIPIKRHFSEDDLKKINKMRKNGMVYAKISKNAQICMRSLFNKKKKGLIM